MIELPYVSMKLNQPVPSMKITATCIADIMTKHQLPPALFVGHSLGSFVVARTLRQRPEIISNVILVDPVCFLLWEPTLITNFIYRAPVTAMQRIQHYHISRELSINHFFRRHFWWHQCVLLGDHLPRDATVFVSQHDDIYDTQQVSAHLSRCNRTVVSFDGQGHGFWIMDGGSTQKIIDAMTRHLCK